jgi:uridine phosphorylase
MALHKVFVVSSGVGRASASPAVQEDRVYQTAPKRTEY